MSTVVMMGDPLPVAEAGMVPSNIIPAQRATMSSIALVQLATL